MPHHHSPGLFHAVIRTTLFLGVLPLSHAQTTWNWDGTGIWSDPSLWSHGIPVAGQDFSINQGEYVTLNHLDSFARLGSLGAGSGQSGFLRIDSTGTLTLTDEMRVGDSGTGTLLLNGGTLTNTIGNIARGSGSTGTATLSSGTWNNTGFLVIGNQGNGTLTLNGGLINAPFVELGRQSHGVGTLNLNDGILATGNIIESSGSGTVNLNGGTIRLTGNQPNLFSGFDDGDVVLHSGGTTFDTNGYDATSSVIFGGSGPLTKTGLGTLSIVQSGQNLRDITVTGGTLSVWGNAFSPNPGNALWNVGGAPSDDATLHITGGSIQVDRITLGTGAGTTGTFNLSGGILTTGNIIKGGGSGAVNFNGGTLRLTGEQPDLFSGFETGDITLQSGGLILDSGNHDISLAPALGGEGGITKSGGGVLSLLSDAHTYSGVTSLSGGSLRFASLGKSGVLLDGALSAAQDNSGTAITSFVDSLVQTLGAGADITTPLADLRAAITQATANDTMRSVAPIGNVVVDATSGTFQIALTEGTAAAIHTPDQTSLTLKNLKSYGDSGVISMGAGSLLELRGTVDANGQYSLNFDSTTGSFVHIPPISWEHRYGGVLRNPGGTLLVENTGFLNNTGYTSTSITGGSNTTARFFSSHGGAIASLDGTAVLNNVLFQGNAVVNHAGARYDESYGGAIYSSNSSLHLENARFTGNSASSIISGGIPLWPSRDLEKYIRHGNDSLKAFFNFYSYLQTKGGAIYQEGGTSSIHNSLFQNNTVVSDAVSIVDMEQGIPVSNMLHGMTGHSFGGAIANIDGALHISGSQFINNSAVASLSALTYYHIGDVTYNGYQINALALGGAVYSRSETLEISDSVFTGNSLYGKAYYTFQNATWYDHGMVAVDTLLRGGAVYNAATTSSITNSHFEGNTIATWSEPSLYIGSHRLTGGAIFNEGGTHTITDSVFLNNSAAYTGEGGVELPIGFGGAILNQNSNLTLATTAGRTSLFQGNIDDSGPNSISFFSGNVHTNQIEVLTATGGLMDMRDPMGTYLNWATLINLTKTGGGVWALGNHSYLDAVIFHFGIREGTLYLYGAGEVENDNIYTPDTVETLAAGSIHVTGITTSITLGEGATLAAGGDNSAITNGPFTIGDGATIRGGSSSIHLGGADPTRTERGGATSLTLVAPDGIHLLGRLNVSAPTAADTFTLHADFTGTGSLTKTGLGTAILTGTSTYSGLTTVETGGLIVNGSLTTSSLTVEDGAFLGGSGHLSYVSLFAGASLAPGNSIGTLHADSLTWDGGAALLFELGFATSDRLELTGDLLKGTAGAYAFTFLDLGWQLGETYTLITFDGLTDFVESDFSFTNPAGFDGSFSLSESSLQFTLTHIPEPSTALLISAALLATATRRRRGTDD